MSPEELTALNAFEAARLIAARSITSEDLVAACLQRVTDDGDARLWTHLDHDHALAQARTGDALLREGRGVGALHGVPVVIEDTIDTVDLAAEQGAPLLRGRQPTQDAACVAALRTAGAVILGKAATNEPAAPGSDVAPSGPAMAIARAMAPLAVGVQTTDAIIRSASLCGIYGFKPTSGLIPRTGVRTQAHSLDTIGVLGRSIEDLALLADLLQAYDPRDPASIGKSRPGLLSIATMEWPVTPTFAFVRGPAWNTADAEFRDAYSELIEALGSSVVEIVLDSTVETGIAAARLVRDVEFAHRHGPIADRSPHLMSAQALADIEAGRRVTAVDYVRALGARAQFLATLSELFVNHGTILIPAARGTTPSEQGVTSSDANSFWTYLGVPTLTLPVLEADGRPLGVQLVGARHDDGRLLRSARLLLEQLLADA